MKTRLRQSVERSGKEPGKSPQLAELESLAHKVLAAFQRNEAAKRLEQWQQRYSHLLQGPGLEQAHEEVERIFSACQAIAYKAYSEHIEGEPMVWNRAGQEAFLRELQKIENDAVFFTSQQPTDYGPLKLLLENPEQAVNCAFYVHPSSAGRGGRPNHDPETGMQSRISLSIRPQHVVDVARWLAGEFGGEFDDMLSRYKILPASEHGGSPDNIVIYLCRADPERAMRFAEHLQTSISPRAWESFSPPGMHRFHPGIAYPESAREASSSYGSSRAALVARAVIKHLVDKMELEPALHEALTENRYSLKNPAFVEREGLEAVLAKL